MKRVIVGHGLVGQALKRAMPEAEWLHHTQCNDLDEHVDELYVACARVGGVAENEAKPAEFLIQNLHTLEWLNEALTCHAKRILLFGSVCMYPRNAPLPHREEHLGTGELEPTNRAYAMAKLCILEAARAYHKQYGTQVSLLIPSNLYGPGDKSTHAIPEIIAKIKRAKETGEMPRFYSGRTWREFLHVDDLARACMAVMSAPYVGPEPINVGPAHGVHMHEVISIIAKNIGYDGPCTYGTGPEGAPFREMDIHKITSEPYLWAPRITLEAGLESLCK